MTIDPKTPYAVSLSFDGTHFQLSVNGNSVLTLAPARLLREPWAFK